MTQLWVVMPVYNEASCIGDVIAEWMPVLRKEVGDFTLCLLNDGSKDNTLAVISELAQHYPELKVIENPTPAMGKPA